MSMANATPHHYLDHLAKFAYDARPDCSDVAMGPRGDLGMRSAATPLPTVANGPSASARELGQPQCCCGYRPSVWPHSFEAD